MPDRLSIHEPVLVNTIGHCAGAVIFGILLSLFVVNWRRTSEERSSLPALAAALAMLWNIGSLIALATGPGGGIAADIIVAASFSVLSLLPAVLLHISLAANHRELWLTGYLLSAIAVALHISDLLTQAPRFHHAALLLVTLGFGGLTAVSAFLDMRQESRRAAVSRLAGAMCLFLFAISFVHFGSEHPRQAWSGEIALHHAGLPLALFVLLQDYRFLLLDAFLRFVVNASLTAGAVLLCIPVIHSRELLRHFEHPFDAGLLFVAACLLLTLFVYVRNRIQRLLTRRDLSALERRRDFAGVSPPRTGGPSDVDFLSGAAESVARFLSAEQFLLIAELPAKPATVSSPTAVLDPAHWKLPSWVQAVVPVRLSRGDNRLLLLGPRQGGRRYLSEDYEVLARLGSAVVEHVEQRRGMELQNLVAEAELRALQAQINPHFLFNSLNTLYGTIARDNAEARRLVLNLADVFRYLLKADRPFIRVEEELKIVRAYIEIEELRLGSKLRTELEIDDEALTATIPVLSIQPLVENAVKHGVAARTGNGFVRVSIKTESGLICVRVSNSGEFDTETAPGAGPGIGLANVRRRLALCYGEATCVEVKVVDSVTTVGFTLRATNLREAPVAV